MISIFLIIIIIYLQLTTNNAFATTLNPMNNKYQPPEHSTEELYKDIIFSLISLHIQKSVNDYYSKFLTDIPTVDPWSVDIISIERPLGYRTFNFILTIEIKPYVSSHIAVGVDHLTIIIDGVGNVIVNNFEHIRDYELPPYINIEKKLS